MRFALLTSKGIKQQAITGPISDKWFRSTQNLAKIQKNSIQLKIKIQILQKKNKKENKSEMAVIRYEMKYEITSDLQRMKRNRKQIDRLKKRECLEFD